MSDLVVNSQIVDAVTQTNNAVLGVVQAEGNGIAHQLVAQSTAMAIQDATELMRNVNAIALAAMGVALDFILTQPAKIPQATLAIEQANTIISNATANLTEVGKAAVAIINSYPSS